ncbi:MAG: TIGR02186 family protein [Peptococcaceae bacterium]|nr:TIGR02186 family protein [Peptococcaceae bacterium]
MKLFKKGAALICALLLVFGFAGSALAAGVDFSMTPGTVDVGMDFAGTQVKVTGTAPEGSNVIIKATAPGHPQGLARDGKVSGLWMTVETATVKGAPGMYQVWTSGSINDIPAAAQKEMGVDPEFSAIMNTAEVTTKDGEKTVTLTGDRAEVYLKGLIDIYKEKGLYTINEGTVQVNNGSFEAVLDIPASVPRGELSISVYAVDQDGTVLADITKPLMVQDVGLVATLGHMAHENPVAYGITAVVIALATGLTAANLFKIIFAKIFKDEGVSAGH